MNQNEDITMKGLGLTLAALFILGFGFSVLTGKPIGDALIVGLGFTGVVLIPFVGVLLVCAPFVILYYLVKFVIGRIHRSQPS